MGASAVTKTLADAFIRVEVTRIVVVGLVNAVVVIAGAGVGAALGGVHQTIEEVEIGAGDGVEEAVTKGSSFATLKIVVVGVVALGQI
jgi:hypothetical protein